MRRLLLAFFVFVLLGILVSLVFRDHPGYLLISFRGWQIETSLLFALAVVVVGLWVLVMLWRILAAIVFAPRTVRSFFGRRRRHQAHRALASGLEHMAEARWSLAESDLQANAADSDAPGLNHLLAARAAQRQHHLAARDRYLARAAASDSVSELAVLLTQAELQMAAGQRAEAGVTLARLCEIEPRHPWVLRLLAEHAMVGGDHGRIHELLPELQRHAALEPERIETMAVAAHCHALSQASNIGGLTGTWRQVPRELRRQPDLVAHYVHCLRALGAEDEAANVIRNALKKQWSGQLALLFGELECSDRKAQLVTVEEWINRYGRERELLLVAGRMCLRSRLWGRARSYFEASQADDRPRPDALLELGHLFESIEQPDEARAAYRQGLELSVSR